MVPNGLVPCVWNPMIMQTWVWIPQERCFSSSFSGLVANSVWNPRIMQTWVRTCHFAGFGCRYGIFITMEEMVWGRVRTVPVLNCSEFLVFERVKKLWVLRNYYMFHEVPKSYFTCLMVMYSWLSHPLSVTNFFTLTKTTIVKRLPVLRAGSQDQAKIKHQHGTIIYLTYNAQ